MRTSREPADPIVEADETADDDDFDYGAPQPATTSTSQQGRSTATSESTARSTRSRSNIQLPSRYRDYVMNLEVKLIVITVKYLVIKRLKLNLQCVNSKRITKSRLKQSLSCILFNLKKKCVRFDKFGKKICFGQICAFNFLI